MKRGIKYRYLVFLLLSSFLIKDRLSGQVVSTFYYIPNNLHTFTVPSCVTTISITVRGAQGGSNVWGIPGGFGGVAFGVMTVTPGDIFYITVGDMNGYNGGAPSGTSACASAMGGSGGGASDVRLNGTSLAHRVIVGGGGGGAGGNRVMGCGRGTGGGGGGGYYGGGGGAGWPGGAGWALATGGSQTSGGVGGLSVWPGNSGFSGTLGIGGSGGIEIASNQAASTNGAVGGAGGGLVGSPGLYTGGVTSGTTTEGGTGSNFTGQSGAGGSSYYGSLANGSTIPGNNSGNGLVTLAYFSAGSGVSLSSQPTSICNSGSFTISASGASTYTWNNASNSSSIVVSPALTSTYQVSATNSVGCSSTASIMVFIDSALPIVSVINNSPTVCQGSPLSLIATGANTYTWSGGISNSTPFTPTASGTYTVTGYNGCGTATAVASVSVNPVPTVIAIASSTSICWGGLVTLSGGGANTYTWSGFATNGVPFPPPTTWNTYTVTGTSVLGCTASAITTIAVNGVSGSNVSVTTLSPNICAGSSATLNASGTTSFTWSTGSNAASISVSPVTTSSYVVQGSNGSGCISNAIIYIQVDQAAPTVTIISGSGQVCAGSTIALTATGANSYSWTGGIVNGVPFTPGSSSGYTVTAANSCGSASAATILTVNANPSVSTSISSPTACSGSPVVLIGLGANTYSWTGGVLDGVPFSPTVSNTYTVIGTSVLGCTASAIANVTVGPFSGTSLTLSTSNLSICIGASVSLNASGVNTYTWSNGSNANAISVSPSSTTSYSVLGTNTSGCNSGSLVTVKVDTGPPAISISGNTTVCFGNAVLLVANGANTYSWTGGITNASAFTPTSSGAYTVTGYNACGTASSTTSVIVNPNPTVTAVASSASVCSGNSVMVTGNGGLSYTCSGGISNATPFIPLSTTVYTISGNNAFGCVASAIVPVTVVSTPSLAPVASQTNICSGSSLSLSAAAASNYLWSPGALTTATIVVSPTVTTTYTLLQSNSTCSDTKTIVIGVTPTPSVTAFASSGTVCATSAVSLSALGALTYTWLPIGGQGANVTVNPTTSTIFTLTGSNGLCNNSTTVGLTVDPLPTITIVPSGTVVCAGSTVTLTATGASNCTWSPGNLTGNTVTVSPMSLNLYTVTGSNSFGCISASYQVINTLPPPVVSAGASNTLICSGAFLNLNAYGASTYSWNTGASGPSTSLNPTTSATYSVIGFSSSGCSDTANVTVSVISSVLNLPPTTIICYGKTVTLTASGASSYTWNGFPTGGSFVVTPAVTTIYQVSAFTTSNNLNCPVTGTVNVIVNPSPTVTALSNKTSICKGGTVTLIGGGAVTYTWSTSQTGSLVIVTPTASQTMYTVTGTDQNNCEDTAIVSIKVVSCTGINEYRTNAGPLLVYPNPGNGDLTIEFDEEMDLVLINELGQVLRSFRFDEQTNKFKVTGLSAGIYFLVGTRPGGPINEKIIVTGN